MHAQMDQADEAENDENVPPQVLCQECQESPAEEAPSRRDHNQRLREAINQYIKDVPEFKHLNALRKKGWETPEATRFFEEQRRTADNATDNRTAQQFYKMMKLLGKEMHRRTSVFKIKSFDCNQDKPSILDMCMAPGGFLAVALDVNATAQALAFSLPPSQGGHNVYLPEELNSRVETHFVDITMLAEDMGVPLADVPSSHPDCERFLHGHFNPKQRFDLAFCDGQVLRTHERESYREKKEATRLTSTQLALALEHLKPGGTMVVLLHRLEAPSTVRLLYTFEKFSCVRVYKSAKFHAKRSSFYMLATDVRVECGEARMAIEHWKKVWRVTTLDVDIDDEVFGDKAYEDIPDAEDMVKEFGPRLVGLGRRVWSTQANALEKAPFMGRSGRASWRDRS